MEVDTKWTQAHSVAGLIIAGGNGMRMGGVQKGLLEWHSKPLLEHIIDRLGPQCDFLTLNVNQQLDRYNQFGLPIINDHEYPQSGPLAGLYAGLSQISSDYLAIVPCDAPLLPRNLVEKLYAAAISHHGLAVVRTEHRIQPTFAIVNKSYLNSLKEFLDRGQRKTQLWFKENKTAIVEFPPENFININTPEDLASIHSSKN